MESFTTVEIWGKKGHLKVNSREVEAWLDKGYSLTPPKTEGNTEGKGKGKK